MVFWRIQKVKQRIFSELFCGISCGESGSCDFYNWEVKNISRLLKEDLATYCHFTETPAAPLAAKGNKTKAESAAQRLERKKTMAKKTDTAVKTVTVSAISAAEAKIAELRALLEEAQKEKNEAIAQVKTEFADKLAAFLPSVGCSNLDEFAALFREYRRGLEAGNGASRSKATPEEKEVILAAYRAAKKPDATPEEKILGNFSALARKFGHSAQNVRNWAIATGDYIVNKRS